MDLKLSPVEVSLRRRLLFRMLKDFDFNHPEFRHEMISEPISPEFRVPALLPAHAA